jgi:hypothetical protein
MSKNFAKPAARHPAHRDLPLGGRDGYSVIVRGFSTMIGGIDKARGAALLCDPSILPPEVNLPGQVRD